MSFGSAVTADDVPEYLKSVRGGREPSPEVVEEFQRRYRLIGRSPLVDITRQQATALQALLDSELAPGHYLVEIGMLHSPPGIGDALLRLSSARVEHIIALVLAPQFSPIIMAGYLRALERFGEEIGGTERVTLVGDWHAQPAFIDALADKLEEGLEAFGDRRDRVPVIFTAHSLPRSVVDRDGNYIAQILDTVELVAARACLPRSRWQFAYQSAGHTPEEWLKPDFKDLLPELRVSGHREVLIVPTQFLADHLEVLYDIDIAGRQEAEAEGITFRRIGMPNVSPLLIRALANLVTGEGDSRHRARRENLPASRR